MSFVRIIASGLVAALAAGMLYSCANQTSNKETAADEGADLKLQIENCQNPDSVRMLAGQVREYAEKLEAEGSADEAAAYLEALIPVIQQRDPSALEVFSELKSTVLRGVVEAQGGAAAIADSVARAGKAKADSIGHAAKEGIENAAGETVNKAKDAAGKAVDKAKDKANAAANEAAGKARDKVNAAKENAKEKAREALGL